MAATKKAKAKKAPAKRKATPKKRKTKPKARTPRILGKPKAPAKKAKSTKLEIKGFESIIPEMRRRRKKIEDLSKKQDEVKADLIKTVSAKRLAAEKRGNFHKTCTLPSDDNKPGLVVFQNKFSKIDCDHEATLKKGLNGHYKNLVSRRFSLSVKPDTTLRALKSALGNKFDAFASLVDVHEFLKVKGEFMEARAGLRDSLTNEENATCDDITAQCQQDPQVKVK